MKNSLNEENSEDFNGIFWQLNLKIMENKCMVFKVTLNVTLFFELK